MARLRLLGNAVVPQVVEHIGRAILMAEHDDRCREYYAAEYDSTPETWDRLGTVHSGDCTGDAWTCDACVREDVERHVAAEKHRQWCIDMGIEPMEDEDE